MRDDATSDASWLSPWRFVFLLAALLVLVSGSGYGLTLVTRYSFPQVMSTVSVLTSVALSAILAYLYFRTSKIQSDQRDISKQQSGLMSRQHELMQAEYTPLLSLGELSIPSKESERMAERLQQSDLELNVSQEDDIPWESLKVPLRNLGRGVAADLRLDVRVVPLQNGEETDNEYASIHRGLEPGSGHHGYISTGKRSYPLTGHWHNFLEPGKATLTTKILFRMELGQEETINLPFSGLIRLLQNQGEDRARVRMDLTYKDITGDEERLNMVVYEFNVQEVETLSDVIDHGEQVDLPPIRENPIEFSEEE
jgi:hypothetical protein